MDWLPNKKINNWKKHRSEFEDELATEVVETYVRNGWLLGWPEPWVGHWILESSFMSWLTAQSKTESDYVNVLLYENDYTARFMTACHRILIDLF